MVTRVDEISTPPTPADPPAEFEQKAARVWSDLSRAIPHMNQQVLENNAAAQSADASKKSAAVNSDLAQGYRNEANQAKTTAAGSATASAASAASSAQSAAEAAASKDAASGYAASIDPAAIKNRANHTGVQAISTVEGLAAELTGLSDRANALELKAQNGAAADRTASRAFGITYTHSGTRKLIVEVIARGTASGSVIAFINGVKRQHFGFPLSDWYVTVRFDVMPGETYAIAVANAGQTIEKWVEAT